MTTPHCLLIPIVIATLLTGCGAQEEETGTLRPATLYGQITNQETGAPVSRRTLLMHFSCAEIGVRDTLTPRDMSRYRIALPDRRIRVRVLDEAHVYEPFEQTVLVAGEERQLDIALRPTHYVLLRARFVDGVAGRQPVDMRVSGEWAGLMLTVSDERGLVHEGLLVPDDDAVVKVRVPRKKLRLQTTNVSTVPQEPELDLRGCEGDAFDLVIRMVQPAK